MRRESVSSLFPLCVLGCGLLVLQLAVAPVFAQQRMRLPTLESSGRGTTPAAEPAALRPTLSRVVPNRLDAGGSYTLTLAGSGFAAGMTANFMPAGVTVLGSVVVQTTNTAQLRVKVAPETPAGFRTLDLSVPTVAPGAGMVALPGPPAHLSLPRAVEIIRPAAATAPAAAGSPFAIRPDIRPDEGPPGIRPLPSSGPSPRLGQSQRQPPAIALRVTRIVPASGEPGNAYTLELRGFGLGPDTRFSFGPDLEISGPPQLLGTSLARLNVKVRAGAAPGPRRLQLAAGAQAAFVEQEAQFAVTAKKPALQVVTTVPAPQILPLDLRVLIKDRIELKTPDWKTQTASTIPPKGPDGKPLGAPQPVWSVDVPILREDQLFSWQETQPGLAEWFEVRFYRKDQQIATRRINALTFGSGKNQATLLPTWLRIDAALLVQLLQPKSLVQSVQPGSQAGKLGVKQADIQTKPGGTASKGKTSPEEKAAAAADLYWEVAGFRNFQSGGVAKSAALEPDPLDNPERILVAAAGNPPAVQAKPSAAATKAAAAMGSETPVEVEVSDRWPLSTPFQPTGLACGADATGKLGLVNLSKKGFTSNETGDVMQLKGEFSLDKSPYFSTPKTSKPMFNGVVMYTTWTFDNLFIDWGDGTQQPFGTMLSGNADSYKSSTKLSLGDQGWTHQYAEPGQYIVRVYQLANDAVQGGGTEVLTASMGEAQGLYLKTAQHDDSQLKEQQSLAVAKQAADNAYMLFCQHVSIAPRTDPDANGPLKLVKIEVQGFPWGEPGKDGDSGAPDPMARLQKQLAPKDGSGGQASAGNAKASAQASGKPITGSPQALSATPIFGIGAGGAPAFSACDVSVTAGAALTYVGQGTARLRWRLDGQVFYEETHDDIGPSPPRPQQTLAKDAGKWGAAPKGVRSNLLSAPIPLDQPGNPGVSVEAEVIHSTKSPQLYQAIAQAVGAGGQAPDAATAQALLLGSQGGPKIGVLTPYSKAGAGLPPVAWVHEALEQVAALGVPAATLAANGPVMQPVAPVDGALKKVAGKAPPQQGPPERVESKPAPFQIVGHDATLPCTFEFPVTDGSFRIGGLQSGGKPNVSHQGNVFSGKGVLPMPVPGSPGKQIPVPVTFTNWAIAAAGFTVEQGKLDVGQVPGGQLAAAGLAYTVTKLSGTAQQNIEATLAAGLAQGNILAAKDAGKPSLPQKAATLSPKGDWYAEGLALPELLLYDSGFQLAPKTVAIDLSTSKGEAPDGSCAASGTGWMGVHLGSGATLTAYDFDLPGSSTAAVSNFGIDAAGLCGAAQMGPFTSKMLRGEFHWDGIKVNAGNGQFTAAYQGLRVKVPWLNVELKGTQDPLLKAGEGVGKQTVSLNLTGGPATRQHGPVTLQAQNLQLVKLENMPPAVRSDTRFDFTGEGKSFAKNVVVNDLYFGLDGRAYLAPGTSEVNVGLAGQSGAIGQATLALDAVAVRAPAGGEQRLVFDFTGKVTISKALEAAKMTVTYAIVEPGENIYAAAGPLAQTTEPFSVAFPKGQETVKGKINATYTGDSGQPSAALPPPLGWIPAAYAAAGQLRFKGTVDMSMFALPMTASFGLGYQGNDDFWAIKAVYDGFGPNGAPLVPPFLNLYEIGGGLGYNVTLESLKGKNLDSLGYASSGGVPVFNALSMVGTPDGFILGLRGDLSIKVAGDNPGTRLDFQAYPLTPSSSWKASPPFQGFMMYQGGSFEGQLWGGMEFLGGAAGVTVPQGAAVVHFGGGDWYAWLGKKSGPRVQGHVLFINGNAYLMLSPSKMAMGGGAEMTAKVGDCDDLCAYIQGSADAGLALTTSPLKLAGTTAVDVSAGGCYDGSCLDIGSGIDAYGELPGPVMRYKFSLDLPCPVPDVDITLKVLPAPGVSAGLDSCIENPFW